MALKEQANKKKSPRNDNDLRQDGKPLAPIPEQGPKK